MSMHTSPHHSPVIGKAFGCEVRHEALLDLSKGQSARVHSIHAVGELGRRLRDMGLLPGVELTVTGRAPLGCPLSISLDGYDLSLRCEEAKHVWVDRTDSTVARPAV